MSTPAPRICLHGVDRNDFAVTYFALLPVVHRVAGTFRYVSSLLPPFLHSFRKSSVVTAAGLSTPRDKVGAKLDKLLVQPKRHELQELRFPLFKPHERHRTWGVPAC